MKTGTLQYQYKVNDNKKDDNKVPSLVNLLTNVNEEVELKYESDKKSLIDF